MNICLYTIENCNKCKEMRDYLNLTGIPYSEMQFKDLESVSTELKNKLYIVNAPILSINEVYYDEPCLFEGGIIRLDISDMLDKYMGG